MIASDMLPAKREDMEALLIRHGIAPTAQRLDIATVMLAGYQHLSAEQVLQRATDFGMAVSKATVYNTLGLFAAHGLVREVVVDPCKVFYDSNTTAHHHFYNINDGTLVDINADDVTITSVPQPPEGTEPLGVDVIVRIRDKIG